MNGVRPSAVALALSSLLAVALSISAAGCPGGNSAVYNCAVPQIDEPGADGGPDPCHCNIPGGHSCPCTDPNQYNNTGLTGVQLYQICMENLARELDAGDAGEGGPISDCNGQCLAGAPNQWGGPELLWIGKPMDAPACPVNAALVGYQGYADPSTAPLPCGTCSCTPLAGMCGLPATITASAAHCAQDGGASMPFDPPPSWDGGCTGYDAVTASVESVTTAPLALMESGCSPVRASGPAEDPVWNTFARACTTTATGRCASTGQTCTPTGPSTFKSCIFYETEGDVECPSYSPYTEKHVFFDTAMDTRECSACACASTPGNCSGTLSIYSDGTCSGAAPGAIPVTSEEPECLDVFFLPGSKSMGPVTYTPGTCQPSGGVESGSVATVGPSTFCCIPPG